LVRPERRTRGDLMAAAAIAVAVALVIATFWWNSATRATVFRPAAAAAPPVDTAEAVPQALVPAWTAASPMTAAPVVIGSTVVGGEGREMTGRDATTGEQRWLFARDAPLCGVSYVYDLAVAVYPDVRGCGQVSSIKAATGARGPTRTSYADDRVVLSSDGGAVLSAGPTRLELWRSDLVRMLSYGEIDARVKPVNTAVGRGCALMSAAASESAVGVLEICPDSAEPRLTLLIPGENEDEPTAKHVPLPGLAPDSDARVLMVAGTSAAVYLPTPRPQVVVYDDTGTRVSSTPLRSPATVGTVPAVGRAGDYLTWWSGSAVLVFGNRLDYRYTLDEPGELAPLGPAAMMAGRLLVPVRGGLAVVDPADGAQERLIALAHPPGPGPVLPKVSGSTVIEQRGPALAGYRPA
jgi:hypothetical protein